MSINYDFLPTLVFTDKGWVIQRDRCALDFIEDLDKLLELGKTDLDMSFLKDRNREVILLLLDKLEEAKQAKYLPLLRAWAKIDYKKIKQRIKQVISTLEA